MRILLVSFMYNRSLLIQVQVILFKSLIFLLKLTLVYLEKSAWQFLGKPSLELMVWNRAQKVLLGLYPTFSIVMYAGNSLPFLRWIRPINLFRVSFNNVAIQSTQPGDVFRSSCAKAVSPIIWLFICWKDWVLAESHLML